MANKYHANKIIVDGIEFDSRKEANRYCELKLLQRAGKISNLQMQVKYELIPAQYETVIEYTPKRRKPKTVNKLVERGANYFADFVYQENGKTIVEDVKGYKDSTAYALFALKRKLMLWVHGIRVNEV